MSADNWARCPQCVVEDNRKKQEAKDHLNRMYGVLSLPDFKELEKQTKQTLSKEVGHTLAENYDIGTYTDGIFVAEYHCQCEECGFEFIYDHTETVFEASKGGKDVEGG